MKKLIIVADWVDDSLTCQEFKSSATGFLKNPEGANISFVSSTPSTIHTSFLASQIVETEERYGQPLETVVFLNTDTRIQSSKSLEKAKGADFVIARLRTGVYIIGPSAGYNFSLFKEKIDELFVYKNLDRGSQFRSRDLYSRVSAHLMDSLEDEMDLDEVSTNNIPVLDAFYIGHIDNFGNIKTTIKLSDLKGKHEFGEDVEIIVNDVKKQAKFVSNLFGAEPGTLVIYPGSSGDPNDRYLEISIWRHFTEVDTSTGRQAFNNPKPGMEVVVQL